jgi:hypothetical protein
MFAKQEEPEPEEMDDEFDPFHEHAHDPLPQAGEEGDDRVHADGEGGM